MAVNRNPLGPPHQFHNTNFGDGALNDTFGALIDVVAGLCLSTGAPWLDALLAVGFVPNTDGVVEPKMRLVAGDHDTMFEFPDLYLDDLHRILDRLSGLCRQQGLEWNLLAVRLYRTDPTTEAIRTQVRGFPVDDPEAMLGSVSDLGRMLDGDFPVAPPPYPTGPGHEPPLPEGEESQYGKGRKST